MAADKQHAHKLIEHLAPDQVPAAIGMLERLLDPVARAIANAPVDDEPLTAADEKALAESREWSKHNKGTPHDEFLAELGITPQQIGKERPSDARSSNGDQESAVREMLKFVAENRTPIKGISVKQLIREGHRL
jgi:hypothetical protein